MEDLKSELCEICGCRAEPGKRVSVILDSRVAIHTIESLSNNGNYILSVKNKPSSLKMFLNAM